MMTKEEMAAHRKAYNKAYREKHREEILKREARYRAENPEKIREIQAASREKRKEKIAATSAAWYSKNKGKVAEKKRRFREENKELCDQRARAWNEANPEKVIAARAASRLRHKDKIAEYRAANLDKFRVYAHNRRQRKRGDRLSPDIVEKLMGLQSCKCAACKVSLQHGYHIDHIEPLARGGANSDSNIQLLCPTCNVRKSARDPIDFMQQKGFLL